MSRIQCPHCGKGYQLTPEKLAQYAGRTIKCKQCQKPFAVASEPEEPADDMPLADEPVMPAPPPLTATAPPVTRTQTQYVGADRARTQEEESNSPANASLTCGWIGLIIPVLPLLFAMLFGILGLLKARKPNVGGKGTALAGIGLALAGLAIHGLILSAMWPRIQRAMETANFAKCAANMRQIGDALISYTRVNQGAYPDRLEQLVTSVEEVQADWFVCPSAEDTPAPGSTAQARAQQLGVRGHCSYVYLGQGMHKLEKPNGKILLYEPPTDHGDQRMNAVYEGGQVVWYDPQDAAYIYSELQSGNNPPRPPPSGWRRY